MLRAAYLRQYIVIRWWHFTSAGPFCIITSAAARCVSEKELEYLNMTVKTLKKSSCLRIGSKYNAQFSCITTCKVVMVEKCCGEIR